MSKKNLDELFQEKLSDFSDVPTEKVWKAIETSLNMKEKKRRIIPIWWKLGGIAAVLAIGLYLVKPYSTPVVGPQPTVTDVENSKEEPLRQNIENDPSPIQNTPEIVEAPNGEKVGTKKDHLKASEKKPTVIFNSQATTENHGTLVQNDKVRQPSHLQESKSTQITGYKREVENNALKSATGQTDPPKYMPQQAPPAQVAAHDISKENVTKVSENLAGKTNDLTTITDDKTLAIVKADEHPQEKNDRAKKSIYEEIAEKEAVVSETKGSKWSAGPNIAPIYFDAIGSGSPVHMIFVPNSKTGDINLSYGIAVAYEISKKLSLKSGVNKVEYGYNTNDIAFSSSLEGFGNGQIENIEYSSASQNIEVVSTVGNLLPPTGKTAYDATARDPSLSGAMAQQFGYLEIPLELNYALIDRKFGVNIIGGVSSLFLIDNSVSLSSGDLTTEMGKANNLNSVNFSTNFGFGFHYKMSSKIQLRVDPIFKYQLNTFSNTAGEFRPFSVGIYSGLNYRF
ncbi:outer membrane beta-barrel protein [Maribacter polysaccharolyticus]|uniref:outer membrane beta-barrel protein n=1 Tax=Maribacter polysaccharolyticus TaxID=3020831 RepID=UPI00237EF5BD|nr:outer membrane beta-barrel protein [Maribacter polysaccharolyticus]MDE3742261.1 outer membrane beta-barrel protein [Maribacter polysaccharolyticus]